MLIKIIMEEKGKKVYIKILNDNPRYIITIFLTGSDK